MRSHTKYEYKLVAENSVGSGESPLSDVSTPQNTPHDVTMPEWTSDDRNTITLTWSPPEKPNGWFSKSKRQLETAVV